jgi:hypothetical protein
VDEQEQPTKPVPIDNLKKAVAFKDDSVNSDTLPGVAPVKLPVNELKIGADKTPESSHENAIPSPETSTPSPIPDIAKIVKENEPGAAEKRSPEVKKTSPEPSLVATGSSKNTQEVSKSKSLGMGDLSDLFAKGGSENTETNKLAAEVNYVDVGDLLVEGKALLERLKKFNN